MYNLMPVSKPPYSVFRVFHISFTVLFQKSEFLHHALYLMSMCNHTFLIYHLVVVVLLNDVQLDASI
jgi:hypothetical protein